MQATTVEQSAVSQKSQEKITYENNKLHKRLCRQVGQAIGDFNMIEDVQQGITVFAAGEADHDLVAFFYHIEIADGLADLTA